MTRLLSAKEAKELTNKHVDSRFDELLEKMARFIQHECEIGNYECGYLLSEEEYKGVGYKIIKRLKDYGYQVNVQSRKLEGVVLDSSVVFKIIISWKSYNEPKATE